MSSDVNEPQEDPKLKDAVKRCWLTERASLELRHKVGQIFAAAGAMDALSSKRADELVRANRRRRMNLWGLAVAASLFLGFGIFFTRPKTSQAAMPDYVAQAFVKTHDRCCNVHDHHGISGAGPNDFATIGKVLAVDMSAPVISTPVAGWQFAGGARCAVYGHESAHLLYRRGNDTLSIFTIPLASLSMQPGDKNFATTLSSHHLSAFVRGSAMYCVVEYSPDGSIGASETDQLRNQLRDNFATKCATADGCRESVASR